MLQQQTQAHIAKSKKEQDVVHLGQPSGHSSKRQKLSNAEKQ